MISEEAIRELEKLSKKNPLIKECFDELNRFLYSPYLESYMTLSNQIADFNEQLTLKPDEVKQRVVGEDMAGNTITMEWMPGKIDLFSDKDDKSFDRAWKYMLGVSSLHESLDKLRILMSPLDQEKARTMKKVGKNSGVAA